MEHQHSARTGARTAQHDPQRERQEGSGQPPWSRRGEPESPAKPRLPRPASSAEPVAAREAISVYQTQPRSRRTPRARVTGLGTGVFATLLMLVSGGLDGLLLGGEPGVYGVVFLLVSAGAAVWVRPAELMAAPVALPIAFVPGVTFVRSGTESGGYLMNGLSALAMHAGWLYAGTLLAVLIVFVRKLAHRFRRAAQAQQEGSDQDAGTPRTSRSPRAPQRSQGSPGARGSSGPPAQQARQDPPSQRRGRKPPS